MELKYNHDIIYQMNNVRKIQVLNGVEEAITKEEAKKIQVRKNQKNIFLQRWQ